MSFNDVTQAGQKYSETVFGEAFSYQSTQLRGVFDWVQREYRFEDFSTRIVTELICVTSKTQWVTAGLAPANRGVITYGGITYQIESIDGADTVGDPAFTLTLKKLT